MIVGPPILLERSLAKMKTKAYKTFGLCVILGLSACLLLSCNQQDIATQTGKLTHDYIEQSEDAFYGYSLMPQGYIQLETSLNDCIEKADMIVRVRVSQVGETYLPKGYTLDATRSFAQNKDAIAHLLTPVNVTVLKTYKQELPAGKIDMSDNATLKPSQTATLQVEEFYGTYQNEFRLYPLENHLVLEEGGEYLLFLKNLDGKYYVLYQPSLVLAENGSFHSMMYNDALYTDFTSYSEIDSVLGTALHE